MAGLLLYKLRIKYHYSKKEKLNSNYVALMLLVNKKLQVLIVIKLGSKKTFEGALKLPSKGNLKIKKRHFLGSLELEV